MDVAADVLRQDRPVIAAGTFYLTGMPGHLPQAPDHDIIHIIVVIAPLGRIVDKVKPHRLLTLPVGLDGFHELIHGVFLLIIDQLLNGGQAVHVLHPGKGRNPAIAAFTFRVDHIGSLVYGPFGNG